MSALASDLLRHFRLLLWICWTEFNEIDKKQYLNILLQACDLGLIGKTKWSLIGWDFFDLEFNGTWQEAISQCPLPSLCFLTDRKNKMAVPASDLLSRTFSTSPLKLLNRIQRNLRGSKISISYTMYSKCVFFGLIGKTRWPTWPLIGWDIFDFSSEKKNKEKRKKHCLAPAHIWSKHFPFMYTRGSYRHSTPPPPNALRTGNVSMRHGCPPPPPGIAKLKVICNWENIFLIWFYMEDLCK